MRTACHIIAVLSICAAALATPTHAQRAPLPDDDARVAIVKPLVSAIVAGDTERAATLAQQHAAGEDRAALAAQARRLAGQFGGDAFELTALTLPGGDDVRNVLVELRRRADGASRFMLVLMSDGGTGILGIALPAMRGGG